MTEARTKHGLIVLNPGHFHAALALRDRQPRLNDDVHIYADDGPDLENFLKIVTSFNERAEHPTRWRLNVYRGPDHFDRLLADRPGDVAIVAGKNHAKMAAIAGLHATGIAVLGDKPWVITEAALPLLHAATAGPTLAMDIMTERHSTEGRIFQALVADTDLFGEFRVGEEKPAIEIRGVHHLYKIVNDAPLVRPAWYFDTAVQGDGIVDVTTHQVDLAQRLVGGSPHDYEKDVELISAEQWETQVPLHLYTIITGSDAFPKGLMAQVADRKLAYRCNAKIRFCLRSIPVEIESKWDLEVPKGGGDTHRIVARGMRCDVVQASGPETGFATRIAIVNAADQKATADRLRECIEGLQARWPGVAMRAVGDGFQIDVPDHLVTGHEAHFAAVLDQFLNYVDDAAWPATLAPDLITKYTLLARARTASLAAK